MKAMPTAFAAIAVNDAGSNMILAQAVFAAQNRASAAAVRLD
jgi:hypothetical protein